jgi:hypothetical protein
MADLLVLTCLSCSNTELHFDATIPIHIYLSYTAKYYEHHKKKMERPQLTMAWSLKWERTELHTQVTFFTRTGFVLLEFLSAKFSFQ